jgi:hypothetical protein
MRGVGLQPSWEIPTTFRDIFVYRERASRSYHWIVFVMSSIVIELPFTHQEGQEYRVHTVKRTLLAIGDVQKSQAIQQTISQHDLKNEPTAEQSRPQLYATPLSHQFAIVLRRTWWNIVCTRSNAPCWLLGMFKKVRPFNKPLATFIQSVFKMPSCMILRTSPQLSSLGPSFMLLPCPINLPREPAPTTSNRYSAGFRFGSQASTC